MRGVKVTDAVRNMREVIAAIVHAVVEGRIDLHKYSSISCETCVHKNKSFGKEPCRSCRSVKQIDERDFRSDTYNNWTPTLDVHFAAIRQFQGRYRKRPLELFLKHPPMRCINPACRHGNPKTHRRGLCRECYEVLAVLVKADASAAHDLLLMMSLPENPLQLEAAVYEYIRLNTWHKFTMLGKALPEKNDYSEDEVISGLETYCAIAVQNKRNPSYEQLSEELSPDQIRELDLLVAIDGVKPDYITA